MNNIQNKISELFNSASRSINVSVSWFTDEVL